MEIYQVAYSHGTVDGQNPAPPRMMIIPLFIGVLPSQVVQDFVHQQYVMVMFSMQVASFFRWKLKTKDPKVTA